MADKKPKDSAKETRREIEQTEQASRRALGTVERLASGMASAVAASARRALEAVGRVSGQVAGSVQAMAQRATAAAQQGARAVESAYTAAYRKVSDAASRAQRNRPGAGGGGPGGGGDEPLTLGDVPKRGIRGSVAAVGGELIGKVRALPVADLALKGLKAVKDFGVAAVQSAMKSQAAWSRLARTIDANGGSWTRLEGRMRATAAQFERATTFSRDEFAAGLEEMTRRTGDASMALEAMGLAADVAAYKKISLVKAAELMEGVYRGEASALQEFGIQAKGGTAALDQLARRTRGFAEGEAQTFSGQLTQLNNLWTSFQVAIGEALISAGNGQSVFTMLKEVLRELTGWVQNNAEVIRVFAQIVITGAVWGVKLLWTALDAVATLITAKVMGAISSATGVVGTLIGAFGTAAHHVARFLDAIGVDGMSARLEQISQNLERNADRLRQTSRSFAQAGGEAWKGFVNRTITRFDDTPPPQEHIPQADTGNLHFRRRSVPPGQGSTASAAPRRAVAPAAPVVVSVAVAPGVAEPGSPQEKTDPTDARIARLAELARLGVISNAELEEAARLQREIVDAMSAGNVLEEERIRLAGRFNALQPVSDYRRQNTELDQEIDKLSRLARLNRARVEDAKRARDLEQQLTRQLQNQALTAEQRRRIEAQIASLRGVKDPSSAFTAKNVWGAIERGAKNARGAIEDSFGQAFEMLGRDITNTGAAFDALWAGIKRGAAEAVAAEARIEAKKQFASAIGQTAKGLGYLASMNFPSAANAFASAAQHVASGAAWSVLAGAVSSMGGAGAGAGGGSSSPQSSRDAGSTVAQSAEKRGPEIHIYVDGIDPTNPRHQKLTQQTLKGVRERYGSDGTVTYAPRRAG